MIDEKKLADFLSGLFILAIGSVFSGTSAMTDNFSYFFFQPDKIPATTYPWYQPRPKKLADFLSPVNTPSRHYWQKTPQATQYRFHPAFEASDYERWRNLDLRGVPIVDTESQEGEFCAIQGSIISNDWLPNEDIEGRCCVCDTGGKWQCEFDIIDPNRDCKQPDLMFSNVTLQKDSSYNGLDSDRITFTGVVRNDGEKISNSFLIQILINGLVETERVFSELDFGQQLSFSQIDFPNIEQGIVLGVGDNEVYFTVENLNQTEADLENNSYTETVTVTAPHLDFEITQVTPINTGVIDELGQSEVEFSVQSTVTEVGTYTKTFPAEYTLLVYSGLSTTPIYSTNFSVGAIPGSNTNLFSFFTNAGEHDFTIEISSDVSDNPEPLENNFFETTFTVE